MIKFLITTLVLVLGSYMTRKELKALYLAFTEKEYLDMRQFSRVMARRMLQG